MISTAPKTGIKISEVCWHEVSDRLDTEPIQSALNEIDLSKYGSGVQKIHFIYVAVQPSNPLHPNDASYDPEEKKVTMELNLPFDHVQNSNKRDLLDTMARLFIVSIDLYEKWEIDDFNLVRFKKDLNVLFESKGLLILAPAFLSKKMCHCGTP